jgi:hypothetical protein
LLLELKPGRGNRFAAESDAAEAPRAGLRLPLLRRLWLNRNQLTWLPCLAGLPHLESLHVSENLLTAVAPLAGSPLLRVLDLSFNRLSGVTPNLNRWRRSTQHPACSGTVLDCVCVCVSQAWAAAWRRWRAARGWRRCT